MTEYVGKKDAVNACYNGFDIDDNINEAVEYIESLPPADVVEVKHGEWMSVPES